MNATLLSLLLGFGSATATGAQMGPVSGPAPGSSDVATGKSLKQWVKDMLDHDPNVRETACRAVAYLGHEGREAVMVLVALANERDERETSVRAAATAAIGTLGLDEKELKKALPGLLTALRDSQGIVRAQAASSLARYGPGANSTIPALVPAAKDKASWETRRAAVFALGTTGINYMGGPDPRAVAAVQAALSDESSVVRFEALMAVVSLGPPAQADLKFSLEKALVKKLDDRDKTTVIWTRVAMMRLDRVSEMHVEPIAQLLSSSDEAIRLQAARALGTIGRQAKTSIPPLAGAVESSKQGDVVLMALWAMVQMGDDATEALTKLSKHPDEKIQKAAGNALETLAKLKSEGAAPTQPRK